MRMKFPISTVLLIVVLGIFAVVLGYNYVWRPFSNQTMVEVQEPEAVASDSADLAMDDSARKWLVSDLTPEQKIGQMLFVPITLDDTTASLSAVLSETAKLQPGDIFCLVLTLMLFLPNVVLMRLDKMLNRSGASHLGN